jgi:spoIIIJ-associated protein
MNSIDSIETTASTVKEAISRALEQLGALEDDVTIEVLSTPRAGVLGLGARQARVRVSRRQPEGAHSRVTSPPPAPPPKPRVRSADSRKAVDAEKPQPRSTAVEIDDQWVGAESEETDESGELSAESRISPQKNIDVDAQAREATRILGRILDLMGESAEIETVSDEAEALELNIKADGSGLLIGRHGQTLDALEYLVNRALARKLKDAPPISIDTESYRARRRQQLHRMALSKGEQVKREHIAIKLDPMAPRDRRIIHLALKEDPMLTTRSSGDGFLRSIQIVPVDERRENAAGRGGQGRRREHELERDRQPVGQQGGFKHGQKRIV